MVALHDVQWQSSIVKMTATDFAIWHSAVRNSGEVGCLVLLCSDSLLTMSISPRIIISVALQQVNDAPDSETCAKGNNQSLENIDSRVKEIHKCVCRNMRDVGLEMGSHNASAGTKTAVRLPIPASPFNV